MSVSDIFLDAEFKCFQNFSITHTFFIASNYMKAQAYILGACRRQAGHVTSKRSCVIHMWLTVLCQLLARAQGVIVSEVHSVYCPINMPRKCVNSLDAFCYICGEVTFKSRRLFFTPLIKKCHEDYFGCKVGDQDKSYAPHFVVWYVPNVSQNGQNVHAVCFSPFLRFGQSPRPVFQIVTSDWPVSLV